MTKRCVVAVLLGCLCLALAACGEEEPDTPIAVKATATTPSPEPTQAVAPAATTGVPTLTPTIEPTALPATPESAPTAAPSPSPAPTEAPSPTPLPTTTPSPQPTSVVTPTPAATPVPSEVTALNFTGVRVLLSEPSQVQATFSLRDQDGRPVILPGSDVQRATRIFERGDGEEAWEELDYTETNFFVHSAERFALEVVFVLDFTRSMTTWQLPDGTAGSTLMRHALERALDRLAEAHRVGVVAFHDRNAEPVILAFPTTDRDFIRTEVAQFAESGFDSGSSRLWDAVARGLDLFPVEEGLPVDVTRALVFLSDGRDTSSVQTRDDVAQLAQERGVQLYPLGAGGGLPRIRLTRFGNGHKRRLLRGSRIGGA